jgi:hypothetical protein
LLSEEVERYNCVMIRIRFTDQSMKRRALGYLAGRFSFKSWVTGEMLVPEYALPELAREGITFIVEGPATYEQITQAVRNPPASAV